MTETVEAQPTKKQKEMERYRKINERFPSTVQLDWVRAFDDIELYGRILRDLLKLDDRKPGRSGPRPALDRETARQQLKQLMRTDYSDYEFPDAFRILAADRSVRALAAKTGLDRNTVHRLLTGKRYPEIYEMEQIAKSFKKQPSYFLEYRVFYILAALERRMVGSPEMTTDLYKRLSPRNSDGSN